MAVDKKFPFQKLDVYVAARELVAVVVAAQVRDAELRDPATRASKSVLLRLAEGLPSRNGPTRRKMFESAQESCAETMAAMDAAEVLGAASQASVAEAEGLGWRIDAMLKGLLGRKNAR